MIRQNKVFFYYNKDIELYTERENALTVRPVKFIKNNIQDSNTESDENLNFEDNLTDQNKHPMTKEIHLSSKLQQRTSE